MVRIWVEVSGEAARRRVGVEAESIEQAVSLVLGSYPSCEVKVLFPLDPQVFFCKEPVITSGVIPSDPQRSRLQRQSKSIRDDAKKVDVRREKAMTLSAEGAG